MVVGVCRLSMIHQAGNSLKAKRGVLNRIKSRVANKFNVSIAEIGSNDLWRRIELGLAVAGNDGPHVNSQLDKVQNFIASLALAEIVDSQIEIIHFNDGESEFALGDEEEEGFEDGEAIDAGDIRGDEE
ncbi:MAG: DUF503 domain-containing protein [Deltaproteobacteria bacterium]|nr:DUF503 domain-containing protein [Deltaproteobacteria bacterium]